MVIDTNVIEAASRTRAPGHRAGISMRDSQVRSGQAGRKTGNSILAVFGPALCMFLALLLVTTSALSAQTEPTEEPRVNLKVDGDKISISINEQFGLPLDEFIKLAQTVTGRVFTYTEVDITNSPNSKISFIGTISVTRDHFFSFFQTMLYIKGFACVLRGRDDTEIVEIVNMAGPKRNEIGSSARLVPPEDIESYASQTGVTILTSVPLAHINANTATTALRPFFSSANSPSGGLIPGNVGNGRAMLLQGYGPSVWAAYQLLRLVDVPPETPEQEYRVQRLSYQTADELVQIIEQVMDERNRRMTQGAGVTGGNLAAGQQPQLKVFPHSSLNAVILAGTKDRIVEALDLIAALDVPLENNEGNIHVIQLKNVLAEDLHSTLRNFITEDLQAQRTAQQGAPGGATQRQPRKTVIVPHQESNSLIVSATQNKFKQLERMILKLDSRQPQVLIEAAVVELSTTDLTSLGVELGLLDISDSDFTRPFGFTSFGLTDFEDTDDDGLPDTRLPDFENPLQGLTGGIINSKDFAIPVLVHALQDDSRANILSLPSIVVNNNEEASVKTEENRPTQTTNQGNSTTQSGFGGFEGAGIELTISPSISSEDYLRLNITLEVSRFLTPFDPASATPGVKATRRIQTQVTLPSTHTMIIGGVIEDGESTQEVGIPWLKDIPLLGYLFKRSTTEERKTNLYFFVTPTILDEDDFSDLSEVSFRKKLEAEEYIGHRRLQIVDTKWVDSANRGNSTLESNGATVEDYDYRGSFDTVMRKRPSTPSENLNGQTPTGPALPTEPNASGTETPKVSPQETGTGATSGTGEEKK